MEKPLEAIFKLTKNKPKQAQVDKIWTAVAWFSDEALVLSQV